MTPTDDQRIARECPPGQSLREWLRIGAAKPKKRTRPQTEIELYRRAKAELAQLLKPAAEQAAVGKLALMRLIARTTRFDPQMHADTVRELAKLLPKATSQARAGNIALLRLILRATR